MVNKGGPAFPNPYQLAANQGLSVRDYFAAKAMLGIMCDPHHDTGNMGGYDSIARYAYAMADAMLAAREGGGDA